jgi:hypothetical protein
MRKNKEFKSSNLSSPKNSVQHRREKKSVGKTLLKIFLVLL